MNWEMPQARSGRPLTVSMWLAIWYEAIIIAHRIIQTTSYVTLYSFIFCSELRALEGWGMMCVSVGKGINPIVTDISVNSLAVGFLKLSVFALKQPWVKDRHANETCQSHPV